MSDLSRMIKLMGQNVSFHHNRMYVGPYKYER